MFYTKKILFSNQKKFLIKKKNYNQKKKIQSKNLFHLGLIDGNFKADILKKEIEKFQKKNLVEILKCGYCQKTVCQSWHRKFLVSSKFCWEAFCKAGHNFNIAK